MQKREKLLAGGLASVVVLWFGFSAYDEQFAKPLLELEGQETTLLEEKKKLFADQLTLKSKDNQVASWRKLSLPPDPLDAQRLYQEWLTTLANLSGFESTKITLERRVAEADTYVTIPITIEAKARLQQIAMFIERFESMSLLQRISRFDIVSPGTDSDPKLTVILTAEGLSMPSAPARARLFPTTELTEPIKRDSQQIKVVASKLFQSPPPFNVRIGNEFLTVTAVDGDVWTVQRGVERTFAENHDANSTVEEFPLHSSNVDPKATLAMWSNNLFAKPSPAVEYKPALANVTPPVVIRGKPWNFKLEVKGWNPAAGTPKFEITSAPAGLDFDEKTTTLKWQPNGNVEIGTAPVQILVWGTNGKDAGFTTTLNLRIRDPNQPPKFDKIEKLVFYTGRESTARITATDPDGDSKKLVYSLKDSPAGMSIDPSTGVLKWTPGDDQMPVELNIQVEVKDQDEFAETASIKLPIKLEEDNARFTYVTGTVSRESGDQEAMINDRATNHKAFVRKGDHLKVADFELMIEEIGNTFLIVQRLGKPYRWQFGQPLTAIRPLDAPAAPIVDPGETGATPRRPVVTPVPASTAIVPVANPETPQEEAPADPMMTDENAPMSPEDEPPLSEPESPPFSEME
ncbi:putative Ig domain-containing protein [Planctomicrobium sp. SH668]|uniref:putative Ig domain-containing protein n=1 Tax=Planctomicrobium sp. SH668 TaxID=3448126 RepID=UPI003F5C3436